MKSTDREWLALATRTYEESYDDEPYIPCPHDLLPEDLNPDFDWLIYLPSLDKKGLLVERSAAEKVEDSSGGCAFVIFWALWISLVFWQGGWFFGGSGFLTALKLIGTIIVLMFIATVISIPFERRASDPFETEIEVPDSIIQKLRETESKLLDDK